MKTTKEKEIDGRLRKLANVMLDRILNNPKLLTMSLKRRKGLVFKGFKQAEPIEGNPEAFWDFVFNGVLKKEKTKLHE